MRHPLHVPLSVPVGAAAFAAPVPSARRAQARHRKPRRPSALRAGAAALASVPPARRLAAGLGLASVLAATVLTATVDPAAPVAPDRVPARESSTFAQVSGD
ncbi:hypothetical protein [Streptomyces sp. NBC_01443]|uniref:hypothetical protein n=1 Tax=Streptomyces sp. NBC_01443 TaxID=2903868 RepID=UPI002252D757|nr:hypothetical protein [Streptomyces sp. NBC_01443]MCX4629992.1 hypothetical protein [Streptomyces sp. NBC_01443]